MTSQELRQKFLNFFEKNKHVIIPSASLVPSEEEQLAGKERVLFTSAGMQPLIPYLMGKPHPKGNKLADVQKCLRTDDIEEVGDGVHHTFFEMLGNWSLGDYWKEGAIDLSFRFLTEELEIPLDKLAISVFAGDDDAPKDEESANKWKSLGVPEKRIAYLGKEANWWPTNPSSFGPCGPDTEMFIWTGQGQVPGEFDPEDPKWVEVWNDVFMEFNRKSDGTLEELPQKNVDTGMGLERILAVLNGKDNDYETDLFKPIIAKLQELNSHNYKYNTKLQLDKYFRIIADYLKASTMLMADGVIPSNKEQGYVVRRLVRKAIWYGRNYLFIDKPFTKDVTEVVLGIYRGYYPEKYSKLSEIMRMFEEEEVKFLKTIDKGTRELPKLAEKFSNKKIVLPKGDSVGGILNELDKRASGELLFHIFETYGLPPDLVREILESQGWRLSANFIEEFHSAKVKHQEQSRTASAGMFKGGLADHSEIVTKYHTATHLLHQALRDVLGPQVFQKGSNITAERLRFDFSYERKMTDEEIKQVENLINERIKQDLKVDHMIIPLDQAKNMNAIGLFDEKYAEKVSIYGVGPNFELDKKAKDQRERGGYYSLEFCGGPHVEETGIIGKINRGTILQGKIKITKEEAVSAGIRRIKAEIMLR